MSVAGRPHGNAESLCVPKQVLKMRVQDKSNAVLESPVKNLPIMHMFQAKA